MTARPRGNSATERQAAQLRAGRTTSDANEEARFQAAERTQHRAQQSAVNGTDGGQQPSSATIIQARIILERAGQVRGHEGHDDD